MAPARDLATRTRAHERRTDDTAPEPVLDDEGHFHATDAPIDLSHYAGRGLVRRSASSGCSALDVFYQFFTRYVLNDSAAWTEEIARYLLIVHRVRRHRDGACGATRHIHVDFLYRLPAGRASGARCRRCVDVVRIAFFAFASDLTIQMMPRMDNLQMTIIDLPMNIIYGIVRRSASR